MAKSPTSEMKANFTACSFHAALTVACAFETLQNNSHLFMHFISWTDHYLRKIGLQLTKRAIPQALQSLQAIEVGRQLAANSPPRQKTRGTFGSKTTTAAFTSVFYLRVYLRKLKNAGEGSMQREGRETKSNAVKSSDRQGKRAQKTTGTWCCAGLPRAGTRLAACI